MTFRKLVVDGEEWAYYVGRTCAVIQAPDGKRKIIGLDELTGRSFDTLDRGQRKKTPAGMVKPSDVVAYIKMQRSVACRDSE